MYKLIQNVVFMRQASHSGLGAVEDCIETNGLQVINFPESMTVIKQKPSLQRPLLPIRYIIDISILINHNWVHILNYVRRRIPTPEFSSITTFLWYCMVYYPIAVMIFLNNYMIINWIDWCIVYVSSSAASPVTGNDLPLLRVIAT